jgi:hypothetical protein
LDGLNPGIDRQVSFQSFRDGLPAVRGLFQGNVPEGRGQEKMAGLDENQVLDHLPLDAVAQGMVKGQHGCR